MYVLVDYAGSAEDSDTKVKSRIVISMVGMQRDRLALVSWR